MSNVCVYSEINSRLYGSKGILISLHGPMNEWIEEEANKITLQFLGLNKRDIYRFTTFTRGKGKFQWQFTSLYANNGNYLPDKNHVPILMEMNRNNFSLFEQ